MMMIMWYVSSLVSHVVAFAVSYLFHYRMGVCHPHLIQPTIHLLLLSLLYLQGNIIIIIIVIIVIVIIVRQDFLLRVIDRQGPPRPSRPTNEARRIGRTSHLVVG